jgi:hypothetical protein
MATAGRVVSPAGALDRARSLRRSMTGSKKALQLILEDGDLIELARILMDDDAEGALAFLKRHLKGKSKDLLEGG